MKRTFKCNENGKYYHEEKIALAALVEKCKNKYDTEVAKNKGKIRYHSKSKIHVPIKQNVAKAGRQFYSDLADFSNDDPAFDKATKLAARSFSDVFN